MRKCNYRIRTPNRIPKGVPNLYMELSQPRAQPWSLEGKKGKGELRPAIYILATEKVVRRKPDSGSNSGL